MSSCPGRTVILVDTAVSRLWGMGLNGGSVRSSIALIGLIITWLAGAAGFVWGLIIIYEALGGLGVIVGFILFPITITVAPLLAAIFWGAWAPFLVLLGAGITGRVMMTAGGME